MGAPFAHELGVFDPTFPGITLHFPNELTWRKYVDIGQLVYSLTVRGMLQRRPDLSVDTLTPEQVYDHVMASPEHGLGATPEEKEELGTEFIGADPDHAVENLAIASTFEHERRHFHDWLLSPYLASTNAVRAEMFVNFRFLEPALYEDGVNALPVPLGRWQSKSAEEKVALTRMWRSMLADQDLRFPDLSDTRRSTAIEHIVRRYRGISSLFEPAPGTFFDSAAIFEASALLIQIQAVHDLFGESAQKLFTSTMAALPAPNRYGWFLQAMSGLLRPDEILENDTVSAIATWCVLGDSTADNEHANPFMRFIAAFEYLQAHGFPDAGTASADVLSSLDRAYGAMPFREVLEHSQEMGKEVASQFFDMAAEDTSGSSFLLGIAQSYGLLLASHLYMVDLFLEDPDGYCRPTAYLDRTLDALPEPPMRHTFGRPFHAVPKESLAGLASYSLFEGSEEADEPALRECVVTLPKNGIDLQVADNWQYLCGRIDAVFADFNRDSPEVEIAKRSALERGARYFEVLV